MSNAGEPSNNTQDKYGWQVKKPVILPGSNKSSRADLNLIKLEKLLKEHSVRVKVYRTSFCPNVKSIDGAVHEIDCTVCNGSGLLDAHPICTHAFFQTQELKPEHFPEGWVMDNTVAVTFPIGIELFYYTLVQLPDYTEIFMQNVQRQPSGPDVLKYKACRVNFIRDSAGIEYYQQTDFKVDQNGSIVWLSGRGPTINTIYTIHYEAEVQFRAIRSLHTNRFVPIAVKDGIKQAKGQEQWILQKEYLVSRTDSQGNLISPNSITPLT